MDIDAARGSARAAARFLKVLGNEQRLKILCELQQGERAVAALERAIGLGQSAVSQHLARLRAEGLVTTRREAQMVYYSLSDPDVERVIAILLARDR